MTARRYANALHEKPPFFLYLEQRDADFLIAVKHSRRKGFQLIRDRLTYGRNIPLQTRKQERDHGRDLTWTLRGMPPQEWVVENWPWQRHGACGALPGQP